MPRSAAANVLLYPPHTVDGLALWEGAETLLKLGAANSIAATPDGQAVELAKGASAGTLQLGPITTEFPFNEAIPSWNGWAGKGSGFRAWMRAGDGRWSTPWLEAGSWGEVGNQPNSRVVKFEGGEFDIDTLMLDRTVTQVEFRIDLMREDARAPSPSLRLLALSFSNTTGDRSLAKRYGSKGDDYGIGEVQRIRTTETLSLPFRSQIIPKKEWIGRICAPAVVSAAAEHFGASRPTQEFAELLYDRPTDAFGVWNRSIQGAAQHGVRGYITRLRNWPEVRQHLQRGHVIGASVRFKLGELADPPREYRTRGTEGHLILINGFAPGGKIVVNNSATQKYGRNELWLAEDLAKAWFEKGGVSYIFTSGPARKRAAAAPQPRRSSWTSLVLFSNQ